MPTIKALEYMDILGFSAFEGMLLDCLFDFEIRDNSFSGILSTFSTRNCMFCGEPCEEFPYSNQETVVLPPFESFRRDVNALVAVCENFQGEGIGSAMAGRIPVEREEPRAPDGHNLLGHPQAEGTARAPEEDRELSIVGTVDFSGETAVADVVISAPAPLQVRPPSHPPQVKLQPPLLLVKQCLLQMRRARCGGCSSESPSCKA